MFQTYLLQAARVLGLSLDKIILLDHKTKVLSKCQNTQDLLQVSENVCKGCKLFFYLTNLKLYTESGEPYTYIHMLY